jgi:folate-binding Fe-S cluster repair protein YgfZ
MLNYDHTGHISFNKGCYTGQEVVARLHYRGKPKRRMYRATLPEAAAAGTPLYCADSSQSVGNVVNSIQVDGAGAAALVVVAVSRVDDELRVGSPDGMPLELTTLPYSIDDTD